MNHALKKSFVMNHALKKSFVMNHALKRASLVVTISVALLTLAGCAGSQTESRYKKQADPVNVKISTGQCFQTTNDVSTESMLVIECAGALMSKGFVERSFLTLVYHTAPPYQFEEAALVYLKQGSYASSCSILRNNAIPDGIGGILGYEIFYECPTE